MKALIIEDDPDTIESVTNVLQMRWPEINLASTHLGKRGIKLAGSVSPNLIILDVSLPDMNGFEVLKQIRTFSKVPILILTVRGEESDIVKGLEWGADDYMVKPFDALELGARVESVIKRKERELDSSPTTKLPGSVAVEKELNRRLISGQAFALCYLDLDNLKAFNDYYGYAKADGVILQTGDIIRKAVEKHGVPSDFVGHIAGDDFVLITDIGRLKTIGQEIIASFDKVIPLYYHPEDQERGYIETEDRFGQMRRFGIMSISLAAVYVKSGRYRSHAEIAARAAELKKKAKSVEGSVLIQDDDLKGDLSDL